jgi:hypothetical protein
LKKNSRNSNKTRNSNNRSTGSAQACASATTLAAAHSPLQAVQAAVARASVALRSLRPLVESCEDALGFMLDASWTDRVLPSFETFLFDLGWHKALLDVDPSPHKADYQKVQGVVREALKDSVLPMFAHAASCQRDRFVLDKELSAILSIGERQKI